MLICVWFELLDLHFLLGESKFMIDKRDGGWYSFQMSEDIRGGFFLSNLERGWCCFLPWL